MAFFGAPSESDIQAKMQRIEQARQTGEFLDPKEMDEAGQEALRRLIKGGQVAPGQPLQHSQQQPQPAPQGPPPPQGAPQQGPPPQAAAPPPQAPMGQPQPQNVAPQQGGIWGDAEALQKQRAMAGLPGVR